MQECRKHIFTTMFVSLMLLGLSAFGRQQPKSLLASANGEGTIKVGKEEFRINAVVVKLMEDGKAELTLVSEITIFLSGSWSAASDVQKGIDLKITGGAAGGGVDGSGKLLLRDDGKSIASLTLQAMSKATKRNVQVSFTAK